MWSVAIVGRRRLFGLGAIEVIAEVRDGRGRPLPGAFVLGEPGDWASARKEFASAFCGAEKAVAGGRTIRKADYFGR